MTFPYSVCLLIYWYSSPIRDYSVVLGIVHYPVVTCCIDSQLKTQNTLSVSRIPLVDPSILMYLIASSNIVSTCTYLLIYQSTCLRIYPSICLSIYLSIHPSIHPSTHPSVRPSVRPSIHPSIYLDIWISGYQWMNYLCIYQSVYTLSVSLKTIHAKNRYICSPSIQDTMDGSDFRAKHLWDV